MKAIFSKIGLFILISMFCLISPSAYSQPSRTTGNIYTKWIKLALVGKNQAEIEYFFRNEKEAVINQVKDRIRYAVLENLRRAGIKRLLDEASDADDLNVVIQKIIIEIRYAGMELDKDLRLSIKEEFGVALETL